MPGHWRLVSQDLVCVVVAVVTLPASRSQLSVNDVTFLGYVTPSNDANDLSALVQVGGSLESRRHRCWRRRRWLLPLMASPMATHPLLALPLVALLLMVVPAIGVAAGSAGGERPVVGPQNAPTPR